MLMKRYSFPYTVHTVLDDLGREVKKRLATDADLDVHLQDQSGPGSPSEHLDLLTRAGMNRFPELAYRAALQRVMDQNPGITRLYASESGGRLRVD